MYKTLYYYSCRSPAQVFFVGTQSPSQWLRESDTSHVILSSSWALEISTFSRHLGDGYGRSLMGAFSQPHPSIETPSTRSHAAPVSQREDWKLPWESVPRSRDTVSAQIFLLISPKPTQSKHDFPLSSVRVELRTVWWLLKIRKRLGPHVLNHCVLILLLDPSALQWVPR